MADVNINSRSDITRLAGSMRKRGKKVVFTNGCFDILHKGHVKLPEKAKSLGDVLVVALNTDA
ncbi:MAG: adenylyltransferase/cytidyltransferase family protein, partial [Candidatus Omnitrophota bacterium]|nr:adenylyltransferase/cytidyltransferase family protein [Candidatus Omnitrophota bacterium]